MLTPEYPLIKFTSAHSTFVSGEKTILIWRLYLICKITGRKERREGGRNLGMEERKEQGARGRGSGCEGGGREVSRGPQVRAARGW